MDLGRRNHYRIVAPARSAGRRMERQTLFENGGAVNQLSVGRTVNTDRWHLRDLFTPFRVLTRHTFQCNAPEIMHAINHQDVCETWQWSLPKIETRGSLQKWSRTTILENLTNMTILYVLTSVHITNCLGNSK